MGAGEPNWIRLNKIGKLPQGQRGKIPSLVLLDTAEKRIEEIKKEVCDDCRKRIFGVELKENKQAGIELKKDEQAGVELKDSAAYKALSADAQAKEDNQVGVEVKCEVEGCGYVGRGRTEGIARNILRMHGKTHVVKE